MTEKVRAIKDIGVHYSEVIADLILQEFSALVFRMQKCSNKYRSYITEQYYLFLARGLLCDQFTEIFFQVIQNRENIE